ncbi:PilC/PilY family type IV pilus protein [Marinobacter sp. NFXS9]|uniref:PilC/PilY family type IV pilus protein n=1 Tax=Marinobacter sp. NFXS9 TaxID=2818433 RepID=UPI0032E031E0
MKIHRGFSFAMAFVATLLAGGYAPHSAAASLNLASKPLFLGSTASPLLMMVMGRNHKLYYEAYNDASDLNNDGKLDVGYKPSIDYYGYFNSYACYDYDTGNNRFVPKSVKSEADKAAGIKSCNTRADGSGANYAGSWSGDFLNYVTMARIDALRKVFYGGYRSTDTADMTVLERTHIPWDAHSWAKEYRSPEKDGYYIEAYTPLAQPPEGKGHLFGNLSESANNPILKVLPNTNFRPWEWASIERPVLADKCVPGIGAGKVNCETSAGDDGWELADSELFQNLTLKYYTTCKKYYDTDKEGDSRDDCNSVGSPGSASEYDNFVDNFERSNRQMGSTQSLDVIKGGNIGYEHYLSIVKGSMVIPKTGDYTFSVDGDDAVEFLIKNSSGSTIEKRISWFGGHSACSDDNCHKDKSKSVYLLAGTYQVEFRHQESGGGDSFQLLQPKTTASSTFARYTVRVQVCASAALLEDNCKTYSDGAGNTSYKPTGLLHDYGENDSILFGLLSGSYENNLDGGVLRKTIGSFKDEVNSSDGTFTDMNGIVSTMNKLRTVNFENAGTGKSQYSCGWITTRPISDGECDMWGNPIAEMMYETVRYFQGKKSPTADFEISDSGNNDAALGLPNAKWDDPYDEVNGQPYCANPYMMVLSDINPNYDSDKVPGSYFSDFSGDLSPAMNVKTLADTITAHEADVTGMHYIGQSGDDADSAPTAKNIKSLGTIRGLAPEEPTKLGSYYSASVAYYGWLNDLFPNKGSDTDPTRINTFAVALASPLPRIEIPVGDGRIVTLVPFAKSPGGSGISSKEGDFQPTNQIVDFYVESITDTEGSFLINFEDVEQGADHDMDAIARYKYKLDDDGSITISVNSLYAAGGIDQHMGYVISGTKSDGIYLVVRDIKDDEENDSSTPVYYLDMPPGRDQGDSRGTDQLPLSSTRTFEAGNSTAATLLQGPLYYAAKWGGFIDHNGNNIPDQADEWDVKNNTTQAEGADGVPDNYFLVTNALGLKNQLSSAFDVILEREASASTVTVNSGELNTDSLLFQATFNAKNWSGNVDAYPIDSSGVGSAVWNLQNVLSSQYSSNNAFDDKRQVVTYNAEVGVGVPFRWPVDPENPSDTEISSVQVKALRGGVTDNPDEYGSKVLDYIRGDQSQETAGTTYDFRERKDGIIGDIANSDPLFVPAPAFFYPDDWPGNAPEDSHKYSDFRKALKDRDAVLYFGANDGMFHAINAFEGVSGDGVNSGGQELLSYVPSMVYGNLAYLSSPNYVHKYYVDGPSTYADAYFSGDERWHTALVGSLRAGGQGLFALDITDPRGVTNLGYPSFNEDDADSLVLWEFSDSDDADLGYTYGEPVIVRMANGKWAAVFGNGYNNTAADGHVSATGNAVLYIVDIETGEIIRKLDTGAGLADDAQNRPNGLATPKVVDLNGDDIADSIYAGDLQGNMWKFDVSSGNADDWGIAYGTDDSPQPLFVAKDSNGNRLPITSAPAVGSHPNRTTGSDDVLVYFGTGKYIETTDNDPDDQNTQSFFAIWDDGLSYGATRSQLLQQKIEAEATTGDYSYRQISDNEIRWTAEEDEEGNVLPAHRGWFIDLINTEDGNTDNRGERVIYEPTIRNDRIIFTTLEPSKDQCSAGGSGWLMELSALSGSRLADSPFDTNNDGQFDEKDLIDFEEDDKNCDGDDCAKNNLAGGGRKKNEGGIPTTPAISDVPGSCAAGQCTEKKFIGTSNAKIDVVTESAKASTQGRQSWREVN